MIAATPGSASADRGRAADAHAARRMRRACAGAVALAASLILALPAAAEPLPTPSDAELAASIFPIDPKTAPIEARTCPVEERTTQGSEQVVTLSSDILFVFDKAELPKAGPAKIAELVQDVPQGAKVSVGGHTDSIGSAARNAALSQERAEAVAGAIRAARPDLALTVEGFAATKPVEPNEKGGEDNPEGRAKNRRVEIRYAG